MKISIKQQKTYSRELDEQAFSVVRLRNEHIPRLGGTGCWVKICNAKGKAIYRMAKGAGAIDIPVDALELDYEGFRALNSWSKEKPVDGLYPCILFITKANRLEALKAHWFHPNLAYSVPMRLGYIGLGLGLIGFVMSAVSLVRG
ncbi:hypothetical protein ICN48_06400 [Polynucleobacter sp. JS-Safj-400b-B2]|uniref:hypothetical protein n=1 Tax=Polynucleobacter sp. JS-Safj-400b-B2 TaxID=2576921 RepID=UPI001C0B17E0|nr:hypothetical protein [Polynucleobacter sp. JS-Safj-400b-B2]MBU3625863.1 hypothetical protein [Polynucleobacter sp. JS-Safj-400b-B2]